MDFSNAIPKLFEQSPLVGGICYREEEERIGNLIAKIERECHRRRKLFAEYGVGNYKAYNAPCNPTLPVVAVMIDNVVAFKEIYEELFEKTTSLFAEAPGLGIYFIVTAAQSSVFYLRTMIAFSQRISLFCNDSSEYINLFDRCNLRPENIAGRGIVKIGKELFEFQTALPILCATEKEMLDNLSIQFSETRKQAVHLADPIPMIPDELLLEDLSKHYDETAPYQLPIGLAYDGVIEQTIDLAQHPVIPILGREKSGRTNLLRLMLHTLDKRRSANTPVEVYIADGHRRSLMPERQLDAVLGYTYEITDAVKRLASIKQELEERQADIINHNGDETLLSTQPLLVFVIGGQSMLMALNQNGEASALLKQIFELCRYKAVILIDELPNNKYYDKSFLKDVQDAKTALITDDLDNVKAFELPMWRKRFGKPIRRGDAYLYLNGQLIDRVRIAKCSGNK